MDDPQIIFLPLLAQVLLTALVWIWMYITRITEMTKKRISPDKLAITTDAAPLLKAVAGPAENFSNLFEVPVLFYIAILTIYITQMVNSLFLGLAILYVTLRYVHSFIHCTYNKVTQRFFVYIASTFVVWVMWLMIGVKIISSLT